MEVIPFESVSELAIVSFVGAPSLVVLDAFADHAEGEDEDEGRHCAGGVEGGEEGNRLHDSLEEEVDVGIAFELQDESQR